MKLSKKIISIVLSALMVISMLPMTAIAADYAAKPTNFTTFTGTVVPTVSNTECYNGYANVLYCSSNWVDGDAGDKYKQVYDGTSNNYIKPAMLGFRNVVVMYDGTNDTAFPFIFKVQVNNKSGCTQRYRFDYLASENSSWTLAKNNQTLVNSASWNKFNASSSEFGISTNISNRYNTGNSNNNKCTNEWPWNGACYYNGTGNTTDYYEVFNNSITFKGLADIRLTWTGGSQWNAGKEYTDIKYGADNGSGHDKTVYVVNYKPLKAAVAEAQTAIASMDPTKYTVDSVNAYFAAVNAMTAYNPNSTFASTNDDNVAASVKTAADTIKNLVSAYNTAKDGLTIKTCTTHNWVDTTEATAATCTADGVMNTKCSECEATSTRVIPATGHSTSYNSTEKTPATCMTQGWTTYSCKNDGCTYSFDVQDIAVNPNAHNMGAYVASADATCENDGQETATCQNGCGYSDTRDVTGSQTGHAYPTTWTAEDASNHVKVCGNDAEHVMREAHNPVSANNAVAPQIGVAGKEADTVCSACGYVIDEGAVIDPLTGPQNSANLTLKDTVNANVQLDAKYYVDEAINNGDIPAGTTVNDVTIDLTYDTAISAETTKVETVTNYETTKIGTDIVVTVESAPAKLSQNITIKMMAAGKELYQRTYSMEDVCEATIAAYDDSEVPAEKASAEVCKTLINYANAAQVYFNYNTAKMAGTKYVDPTDASTVNYGVAQDETAAVKATGMTFVALANAEARLYLEKSEADFYKAAGYMYGALELEVSGVEGITAYLGKVNDRVFIGVTGIKAAYLDDDITVTVKKDGAVVQEITFTAVTYAVAGVQSSKESLKNLSQAIINYNAKANDLLAANQNA